MQSAYHFFYANAGYSYDPTVETQEQGRQRCAARLAEVEQQARDMGYSFRWELDDIDSSDFSDDPEPWRLWVCTMCDEEGNALESLGGIDFGRDGEPWGNPYQRVVETELASGYII